MTWSPHRPAGIDAAFADGVRDWAAVAGVDLSRAARLRPASDPAGTGTTAVAWDGLDRSGRRVELQAEPDGRRLLGVRPALEWSGAASAASRVVVVPDVIVLWKLLDLAGGALGSTHVLAAPISGDQLPPECADRQYWAFDEVIVLADDPFRPTPMAALATGWISGDFRLAFPPGPSSWLDWASGTVADPASVIAEVSRPARSFARIVVDRAGVAALARSREAVLDGGVLLRLMSLESSAPPNDDGEQAAWLLRSDRTCAPLVPAAGTSGSCLGSLRTSAWSAASARSFLRGGRVHGGEVGRSLRRAAGVEGGVLTTEVALTLAFVALTYVYPAFRALPLLVIEGGLPSSRFAWRRFLHAICLSPTTLARTRGAQLARTIDAAPGTIVLEEPGPLCGPSGPTEIGRVLDGGLVRDASAYAAVSPRGGVRQLDLFGPKVVLGRSVRATGLACPVVSVDLDALPPLAEIDRTEPVREAVDALLGWSMDAVADMAAGMGVGVPAEALLDVLSAALFADGADVAASLHALESVRPDAGSGSCGRSPEETMGDVIARCGNGGWLSMVQVRLELLLAGDDDEAFSPERVGRCLASRAEVDAHVSVERRRLFGQISRIYPLDGIDRDPDASAAFAFCRDVPCDACRYATVCESGFPGMRRRKRSAGPAVG